MDPNRDGRGHTIADIGLLAAKLRSISRYKLRRFHKRPSQLDTSVAVLGFIRGTAEN